MAQKVSMNGLSITIGIITALGMVSYFFIMKAFDLSHIIELRVFNFVILATGICYGIKKSKQELNEEGFYLKGLAEGVFISLIAVISFAVFMSLYLSYFDFALMDQIKSHVAGGEYVNGLSIFILIFMEGMGSGFVISFAAMQYFKDVPKKDYTIAK